MRASVADEVALARTGQRSSVIIDEAGTAATRFRPTEEAAALAKGERASGPVELNAPRFEAPDRTGLSRAEERAIAARTQSVIQNGLDVGQAGRAGMSIEEIGTTLRTAAESGMEQLLHRTDGIWAGKIKPSVSVVMDRTTGDMSRLWLNNPDGALPRNLPDELRLRALHAERLPYDKSIRSGSHSEVYAASELLNRGSKLEDLVVFTMEPLGGKSGMIKPPCPHCNEILEGVTYVR